MRMYIQLIGSTAALPSGAAETAPTLPRRRRCRRVRWPGR
jgi:hypothetical protein